uniref:Uncharacterized protein n=1 Tax=Ficus carica TaxID=3494 RepID=A0AA88CRP2_FICCA|nr:hypothetical protein TIFTF001_047837 [Ficus carica]
MDPARVAEERYSITSFYELHPLLFKGTRRTVSLAVWLYDTERIFRTSHIVARLQVSLASRCLVADAHLWWLTLGELARVPTGVGDSSQRITSPDLTESRYLRRAQFFLEDPIPAVPLQKVPTPEVEIEANDYDADDDMDAPEDPPIIDISNDDEDEDMEPEPESGDWIEDADNLDDDPEEILYDDGDWDTDSDASSVITI